jgi:hypothetical protein
MVGLYQQPPGAESHLHLLTRFDEAQKKWALTWKLKEGRILAPVFKQFECGA